jgi:hypothetical protein
MDGLPINTKILGNPLNWLIVWLMLFLGGALLDVCCQYHVNMSNNSNPGA